MKTVKTMTLLVALVPLLAIGQATSIDRDGTALIARVRQTLVSQFDSKLPNVSFEEWLRGQIGSDATVAWAVRTGEGHGLPRVEADISIGGQPGIVILVDNGKQDGNAGAIPRFKSLQLVRKGESAEWRHLHDLPQAIRRARGES